MREFPHHDFASGEVVCVGAGFGGGFEITKELHVMKYKKAMVTSDSKEWELAVKAEHDRNGQGRSWGGSAGQGGAKRRKDPHINLGNEEEMQWDM
jgi:hypothetical protein